jgi:hypothetical protein
MHVPQWLKPGLWGIVVGALTFLSRWIPTRGLTAALLVVACVCACASGARAQITAHVTGTTDWAIPPGPPRRSAPVTIAVALLPDGSAIGTLLFYGIHYAVVELVPPAGYTDFWCIGGEPLEPTPFNRIHIYVRHRGDGRTTFDEVALMGSSGTSMDCRESRVLPPLFFPVTSGDYQTIITSPPQNVRR